MTDFQVGDRVTIMGHGPVLVMKVSKWRKLLRVDHIKVLNIGQNFGCKTFNVSGVWIDAEYLERIEE